MAKIVKRARRRKLNLTGIGLVFLVFSLIVWLATSLLLSTVNNQLTIKIQKMSNEIASLKTENQSLNIEIQSLENKDRVYVIAQDAGLNQNQDNIISVKGE